MPSRCLWGWRRVPCRSRWTWILLASFILAGWIAAPARAVPPLVAGDVPPADRGTLETFAGFKYQDSGAIERQVPALEFAYGISSRQEITLELPYLSVSQPGAPTRSGIGDATIGTKYVILPESENAPGFALSLEIKLDNGDETKGLGSGARNAEARSRVEKTWGDFTEIANLGYTAVGEPEAGGQRQARNDVWFAAWAQYFALTGAMSLLADLYLETPEEPGGTNRIAADIGVKQDLSSGLQLRAALGKSVRNGNEGGPDLRAYVGLKTTTRIGAGEDAH